MSTLTYGNFITEFRCSNSKTRIIFRFLVKGTNRTGSLYLVLFVRAFRITRPFMFYLEFSEP